MKTTSYQKLAITMLMSFFIMYTVMFLNVDSIDHIYLSATRFYMTLLMVSPMALLMLWMMKSMYPDKKKNALIMISSLVVIITSFTFLRAQTLVSDTQYMKAMIPHHSSAIMTSKHANIKDPELKKLSESIIKSQESEIDQMKRILSRLN